MPEQLAVVLGVDGGGTKTHAALSDAAGNVLGAETSGASNWEEVGLGGAGAAIAAAIRGAAATAGVDVTDIAATTFGLAGLDWDSDHRRLDIVVTSLNLRGKSQILNDAFVALRAGTPEPVGIVVVAGTGSVTAGRNRRGELYRTLGEGPTFGDYGSASDVSDAVIGSVAAAHLGRGPATMLSDALCRQTGTSSVATLLESLSRDYVEAGLFAPPAIQAAEEGDEVARAIVERAGAALGATAAFVTRRLRMEEEEFDVVLAGGLFRSRSSLLLSPLERELNAAAPRAHLVCPKAPPVAGAVLLAMELGGFPTTREVHERVTTGTAEALYPERW